MTLNYTDRFQYHTKIKLKFQSIEVVEQIKDLGTIFRGRLSWNENSDSIVKKGKFKNATDKKKEKIVLALTTKKWSTYGKPSV